MSPQGRVGTDLVLNVPRDVPAQSVLPASCRQSHDEHASHAGRRGIPHVFSGWKPAALCSEPGPSRSSLEICSVFRTAEALVFVPPAVDREPRRFGRIVALALGVCAMLVTGCASRGTADKTPAVQSLHLFSVPQAINLDDEPGPDGFAVRLFARGPKSSKGVAFPNGAVEIAMFEGLLPDASGSTNQPLRTWEFTGSELKQHAGQSAVGTGYRFTLRWTDARPTGSRISIVARYLPTSGPAISSAPSSVVIGAK